MLIGHLESSLVTCTLKSFVSFKLSCLFLIGFRTSVYILDMNSLLDIYISDIISQTAACFFTLLLVSFDRVLNFNQVQLINFFLYSSAICVLLKKSVPCLISCTHFSLLSSRSSIDLPSTFRASTHLEECVCVCMV